MLECFSISPPELGREISFSFAAPGVLFAVASTLVTTARRLSVTKGNVICDRMAPLSRVKRARTCEKRAAGLVILPRAPSGALQSVHVLSGTCGLPVRVD